MAKRHVEEYFNKVAEQYHDMVLEIKDLEEYCKTNVVDPNVIDNMTKLVEPLKNNFMIWSYVMYLMNLPNNEKKCKAFHRREKVIRQNIANNMITENDEIISNLKENNQLASNL